jgi:molybdenum cofactor cytidylyltransferase
MEKPVDTDFFPGFCYVRDMSGTVGLCGVILAAGDSTRMGTDKALLPWPPLSAGQVPSGTFLSAAIQSLTLQTELVLVVAGRNAPTLAPVIYGAGASMLVNPEPDLGQFSSLQVGLREVLNRGRDAAIITLVDRPPASEPTINKLYEAFLDALHRYQWAVIPEFQGRHGHPFVVGREMIEAFLKAPPDGNAREIRNRYTDKIVYVEVDDPMTTANINTPAEYASLPNPTKQLA